MTELKNCAHCNGQAKIKRCGQAYFRIVCDQCKTGTSHCATIEIAKERWNNRENAIEAKDNTINELMRLLNNANRKIMDLLESKNEK